jgi:undecaprenyl diphosphate synthase
MAALFFWRSRPGRDTVNGSYESEWSWVLTDIAQENLPAHVAIIMDGNGRWAQARGLNRLDGHREGVESVRAIIKAGQELSLRYLTLYTFSEENWRRPKMEVSGLMLLLDHQIKKEVKELHENNVRINVIGDMTRLPKSSQKLLRTAMKKTEGNTDLVLTLALSYGGRQEILSACRKVAQACLSGETTPDRIDEAFFRRYLYSSWLPDPDLLIRTGGENRVSNFLLWQIAYTEVYVTDMYWPDFREDALRAAIADYARRQRRFGMTGEQVAVTSRMTTGA